MVLFKLFQFTKPVIGYSTRLYNYRLGDTFRPQKDCHGEQTIVWDKGNSRSTNGIIRDCM